MTFAFLSIRVLDIIDILAVAFLMYQVYKLIRGTIAMNIFVGIFSVYLLWLVVKALNMQLLGSILGQVIGVGVIALIVVFQQEIRRFLIFLGNQYYSRNRFTIEKIFPGGFKAGTNVRIKSILKATINLANGKTGALIVITRKSRLLVYAETGDIMNAQTSSRLIESIFNKESPLHDGAIIIENEKVLAARCVLPVSENINLPPHFGMRHRAAIGITEHTDALVIVVSEETGGISIARNGKIRTDVDPKDLLNILEENFG